jgi:hypothetical protein
MIDAAPVPAPTPRRRIRLVADDYGISPAVNGAIRDLIARGRLNATSVMVVTPAFNQAEAGALAALAPAARFSIGLHLTLTAPFAPLSRGYAPTRNGAFLPLWLTAARAVVGNLGATALTNEIGTQIDAFAAAFGRPPDYIDGHQHVHLFPQIGDCLLKVMTQQTPAAWVRQCGPAPGRNWWQVDRKGLVLDVLSRRFRRRARAAGVPTNPAFAGTYDFRPEANFAALFANFLADIPDAGVVMCHPGVVDAELVRLDPLTSLREREYEFFGSEGFPAMLANHGVALM